MTMCQNPDQENKNFGVSHAVCGKGPEADLLYRVCNVYKSVGAPGGVVEILRGVSVDVAPGDTLAIVGASGSGKSTLLHLIGSLGTPTQGEIFFEGRNLADLSDMERAHTRNHRIGFVFQAHHLLPEFTALENTAMPALIAGQPRKRALEGAFGALELVDMAHRAKHGVTTLSGGEQQRVAIARAILLNPAVLLADEPTGNLDARNSEMVGRILADLNQKLGMVILVVTHNKELAACMMRNLELRDGVLYA